MVIKITVIILIILILLFIFFREEKEDVKSSDTYTPKRPIYINRAPYNVPIQNSSNIVNDEPAIPEGAEIFIDDSGKRYYEETKTRLIPRRTHILGVLIGKFRGDKDFKVNEETDKEKLYDFEIYEGIISNIKYAKNRSFRFSSKEEFPSEKLPQDLYIENVSDGKIYKVNIREPRIQKVQIVRNLHQIEENQVFGTLKAEITGYLLDFIEEQYIVRIYIEDKKGEVKNPDTTPENPPPTGTKPIFVTKPATVTKGPTPTPPIITSAPEKTLIPTGNTELDGIYKRIEYWYDDFKTTYWGNWFQFKRNPQSGCLENLGTIIGLIFMLGFIFSLGPKGVITILLIIALFYLLSYFSSAIKWVLKIAFILIFIGFISSLLKHKDGGDFIKPKPQTTDNDIRDTVFNIDPTIIQKRVWSDYDDNIYEGTYKIRIKDIDESRNYKNYMYVPQGGIPGYDLILTELYNNDKNKIGSIYSLLDSIRNSNNLDEKRFAEMAVCFVQDIPYTIVLDQACDPRLYSDIFTKSYLENREGDCFPNARFGINTPVEFVANLKGDCDTRTLLLYTILAHYGYDVAILSSELYAHSVLGINLPYPGVSFKTGNKKYVIWETTAFGIRPGILPREVSNINYWRISKQSKL